MDLNTIETLLRQAQLRFTREVDPAAEMEALLLPFDTAEGVITVRLSVGGECLSAMVFLRALDGLGVQTTQRDLYLDLLRANFESLFARAFVWRDPGDEVDWIAVAAEVPSEGLTSDGAAWVVSEVGGFAQKVLTLIAKHSSSRQGQLR